MKLFLSTIITLLLISQLFSQDYSRDQVIEGLKSLKANIEAYNPALKDYNPQFEEQAQKIIASVDQTTYSAIALFKLVTELCAISNEGHFAIGSWNDTPHSGFTANTYRYLPVGVQITNNKIYLWNDYSNENQLERGDEITSINGKSSSEILAQLMRFTESDGNIEGYAYWLIRSGFNWRYYLYIESPETFEINYKKLNTGEEDQVTIQALTNEDLLANYRKKNPTQEKAEESVKDVYELDFNQTYAVLKLKSFTRSKLEKYDLKSTKFYQEIFESINAKGVSTLIIDLRNNSGGRKEFANDLVPFIMQIDSNDPYLRKSISWAGKKKEIKLPKKHKSSFQGDVFVVVNSRTFSAASSAARFLKEYANAIVVGQETATRYEGFSAGSKQYVTVPHTDIEIGIPRYQTIYPVSQKQTTTNRGLIPDHLINYSIKDLIDGKDLEMDFIINNLIK